jgi:septal ring-binding cell division protein DamX
MQPKRGKSSRRPATTEDRRRLLMATGLLAAVLVALLAGALLQTDPTDRQAALDGPSLAASGEGGSADVTGTEARDLEARQTTTDSPVARLGRRALQDAERLADDRRGFTLQLAVACQADTVSNFVEQSRGDEGLYVLPMTLDGRSCFRVCFGRFETSDAARRRGLPPALAAVVERPLVREINEVLTQ